MDAGLCADCAWARGVDSKRGPTYLRCARAEDDATFEKYPRLPRQACRGFAPLKDVETGGDAEQDRR